LERLGNPSRGSRLGCSSSPERSGSSSRSQTWHAHTVELTHEGIGVNLIQRQLGHTDLGTTSTYLQGIDPAEIIEAVHSRRAPMTPATAALRL
jgi:hypothetical protein